MPALLYRHGLALHVGGITGELLKVLANIVEMLEPLIEGDRVVRRQRIVNKEDRGVLM